MKRLYRSKENRVLFGIIGGLAEYVNQDVIILRILFIFLLIFTGFFPFGLFYFACLFVIPEEAINIKNTASENKMENKTDSYNNKTEVIVEEIKVVEVKN